MVVRVLILSGRSQHVAIVNRSITAAPYCYDRYGQLTHQTTNPPRHDCAAANAFVCALALAPPIAVFAVNPIALLVE